MRLLVVDDIGFVRNQVVRALSEGGYQVVAASSAGDALKQIAAYDDIGVVITDQEMPGMTGTGLCAACRERFPGRKLGFILLTGSNDLEAMRQAKALGFRDVLVKPPDFPRLLSALESLGCVPATSSGRPASRTVSPPVESAAEHADPMREQTGDGPSNPPSA